MSTIEEELAVLRHELAQQLPSKLEQLRHLVEQALAMDSNQQALHVSAWEEARLLAHHLRGSCGMFGFTRVGQSTGRLDDLFARHRRPSDRDARLYQDILAETASLAAALGEDQRSPIEP